jgi:hypothetical protein
MNKEDVKVGDIRTVESIDRDGDIWTPEMRCTNPSRVRPATPEDIAPKLWQSYKDILNNEALTALEQVIMGEPSVGVKHRKAKTFGRLFIRENTINRRNLQ